MKGRKVGAIFYFISMVIVCICFTGTFSVLPDKIHLFEGEENNFSLGVPIAAEFHNENIGVLSINRKPVEGNIHINLNKPFSVIPERSGSADVSLSLFGVIPLKTVSIDVIPKTQVIACGATIGVKIHTNGIMVLGTGYVNTSSNEALEPAKGILKSGDLILQANKKMLHTKEDLEKAVEETQDKELELVIKRGEEEKTVTIQPVKSSDNLGYKIGAWVRDSTQGLGTITFYQEEDGKFGALGHGIYDVDTKQLMSVKSGQLVESQVTGVKKGEKGSPGEILGNINKSVQWGSILSNTEYGLYGVVNEQARKTLPGEKFEIALQQDVVEGEATIRTDILGGKPEDYTVTIESVNRFSDAADKGMIIRITDKRLLEETGGIIQGMSGSPIFQNGKIIGAVTHVFVQDPTKGYGIFIENMLKEEMSIAA